MKKGLLLLSGLVIMSGMLIAQPSNDNCAGALPMNYAATEAELVLTNGDSRGGTPDATVPDVCSGTWFNDDVWYFFTAPDPLPSANVIIKTYFGTEADDVTSVGMAIYTSCAMDASPLQCFSSDDPNQNQLEISAACLEPNANYLIRVWSGGTDIPGTFRIGAFAKASTDVILWSETFGDGLAGWSTFGTCGGNADSNGNALFRYYSDGVIDMGAYANPGVGVSALSVCDGAVGVDCDFDDNGGVAGAFGTGRCPTGNGSQYVLVSPSIAHGEWNVAGITISFRQGLREYQSEYFVSYRIFESGAWGDWRNYEINTDDEYAINSAHYNNEARRVFLGGAQAGDSLQIRFVYDGNYYYWGIDDILLIEAPCVDLRSMSNWYAIAPAVNTPSSQVRPWWPLNDVYNSGACTQTNVNLNCTIMNSGGQVVYNDNVAYGSIEGDVLVENVNFPSPVMVPTSSVAPDTYTGTYLLTSDQSTPENDFNFADNSNTFSFSTTEDVYALETGFTRSVAVSNAIYDPGAPLSYTYGNYFFFPQGSDYKLRSVTWGVANPSDVAGIPINLILFKWVDANDNEIAESSEREILGFATHVFDGSEPDNTILETVLESFTGGDIVFEDNASYLMMAEFNGVDDETFFFLLASEDYDYGGVVLSGAQAGMPTYASVLGFSSDGNVQGIDYEVTLTTDPDRVHFGWDIVPLIRLNIDDLVGTKDLLPEENVVKLYPSPASENVKVDIEFTQRMENVQLVMVDAAGRSVFTQNYENMDRAALEFNVSRLPSGAYTMQVNTERGVRAVPFVVQH